MSTKLILATLSVAGLGLTGCTSLQPREAFPGVAQQVLERTGARSVWNQGGTSDQAADASVRELLAGKLTADSAVQIALLNNRNVQVTYEELGIAQAELVQAGLLSNPVFSALLRFPDGGRGNPNLELSVSENFIELLSLPLRKKVAAAQYEGAKARVAGEVVSMASEVKRAFYTLQGAKQMLDMRRSVVMATSASVDLAQRLRAAGNTTELAVANEKAFYGQARLDFARAEVEVAMDRERLITLMGLWGQTADIQVDGMLPELPGEDAGLDHVESVAVRQRLDLRAAVNELNANFRTLRLTRQFALLGNSEVTVDTEHEVDGSWVTGPGLSIPIPIFDTGAARVSVAGARLRQASARAYAFAVQVRSEARTARAELLASRQRVMYFRATVLPLRAQITRQTQLQYNAMTSGAFQLLQARRDEIDAGRDCIAALQDYWVARTDLERAVGGVLPNGLKGTAPAIQPATRSSIPEDVSHSPSPGMATPTHTHQHQTE